MKAFEYYASEDGSPYPDYFYVLDPSEQEVYRGSERECQAYVRGTHDGIEFVAEENYAQAKAHFS
jgi:hypothetical protein